MITIKIHANGKVLDQTLPLHSISDVIEKRDHLLWVDANDASPEEISLLQEELSLHPLAVEDATHRHERPKVEQFDRFVLLIFYALTYDKKTHEMVWNQVAIFGGHNYVLTLHSGALPLLDTISDRWCQNHEKLPSHAPALLIYALLDGMVDEYLPVIDELSDRIDALEDAIFADFDKGTLQEIFRLKRELLLMRKILTPERDVLNVLMRRDMPFYQDDAARYFQDIYDHLLRVLDSVDTYRDLISSALESYLSVVSNRLNQVMKTLTASSIILMTMALISGIYGMNFRFMPELEWHYGYFMALGLMAALGTALGVLFRRNDWF